MSEKYEFVDTTLTEPKCPFPVILMCRWLDVSTSGFSSWRARPDSATARRRDVLKKLISAEFTRSDETYGYRRLHAALARRGVAAGRELVRHLTRELGLLPCQPRPSRLRLTSADAAAGPIPDLVGRDFTADAPGHKLVGDITYIPTWEGWVFLATVIDCYSKKVIAHAMDDHYRTSLITTAIRRAAATGLADQAIFHTDRGSNYTSAEFHTALADLGLRHSTGRTAVCYDNAMAESFFAALKNERVHRTVYPSRAHAVRDITTYIDSWYNTERLHSGLGYQTPSETHAGYQKAA